MLKKVLVALLISTQFGLAPIKVVAEMENVCNDSLLISITNEESLKFKTYSKDDFGSEHIIEIHDLTESYKEQVLNGEYSKLDAFNRVFSIMIDTSKTDIYDVKEQLEKNEIIKNVDYNNINNVPTASIGTGINTNNQWLYDLIDLESAWSITTGSSSVKVGIADTGIDITNQYISSKVDTSLSRSFVDSTEGALQDVYAHGTKVAGVVGAMYGTPSVQSGICQNVTLVSLKIFANDNPGTDVDTAEAINYANGNGIGILNVSIGSSSYNSTLEDAIENYSGLIVCSAGNDSKDIDTNAYYLGRYTSSNILCVGASTSIDTKGTDSNYGKTNVDLFAPGYGIYTTDTIANHANGICKASQTSIAAPVVTGVAALIKSKYPNLTTSQIKYRITANLEKVSALSSYCVYGGRINAYNALANNNHNHNGYTKYNLNQHYISCSCGYQGYENHTWVENSTGLSIEDSINGLVTGYKCKYCGETTIFDPYI